MRPCVTWQSLLVSMHLLLTSLFPFYMLVVPRLHVGYTLRVGVDHVVGEVDEELGEASLGGSVVSQD